MSEKIQSYSEAEHESNRGDADGGGHRTTAEWLPAELERLRVVRTIERPARQVEESLRVRPERLIQVAYGSVPDSSATTILLVPFESLRWLRVPVRVESWTPGSNHRAVISIRWQASRFTSCFPIMDADLEVRSRGSVSELVLEGKYRPPFGLVGLILDRFIARRVARATATTFLDRLGDAIEADNL